MHVTGAATDELPDAFRNNRTFHHHGGTLVHNHNHQPQNNEVYHNDNHDEQFLCGKKRASIDEFSDPTESCSSDDSSCCSFYDDEEEQGINVVLKPIIKPVKRQVLFGSVQVREYASTVGDHPLCVDSCPLTLDWGYSDAMEQDLETYESKRFLFRRNVPRRLDIDQRRDRIKETCDMDDESLHEMEFHVALTRLGPRPASSLLDESMKDGDAKVLDDDDAEMLSQESPPFSCVDRSSGSFASVPDLEAWETETGKDEEKEPLFVDCNNEEKDGVEMIWKRVVSEPPTSDKPQRSLPHSCVWV
ncbi:hypothetical protein ACA910_021539 [Epithemia clementina (nom. ined.)]